MKHAKKHHSVMQNYIDLSDRLAAGRSALGFIYVFIAAILIFTCFFHAFFVVKQMENIRLKGNETEVIVSRRRTAPGKGDIILLKNGEVCKVLAASGEVFVQGGIGMEIDEGLILVAVPNDDGSASNKIVSEEDTDGKIYFIIAPLSCFGDDPGKLLQKT
ncbi:MAG: hypothetical protein IJ192_02380 [Clostridia bacterium]|nr:hypothetical protein [Clostridia bacterium]